MIQVLIVTKTYFCIVVAVIFLLIYYYQVNFLGFFPQNSSVGKAKKLKLASSSCGFVSHPNIMRFEYLSLGNGMCNNFHPKYHSFQPFPQPLAITHFYLTWVQFGNTEVDPTPRWMDFGIDPPSPIEDHTPNVIGISRSSLEQFATENSSGEFVVPNVPVLRL